MDHDQNKLSTNWLSSFIFFLHCTNKVAKYSKPFASALKYIDHLDSNTHCSQHRDCSQREAITGNVALIPSVICEEEVNSSDEEGAQQLLTIWMVYYHFMWPIEGISWDPCLSQANPRGSLR